MSSSQTPQRRRRDPDIPIGPAPHGSDGSSLAQRTPADALGAVLTGDGRGTTLLVWRRPGGHQPIGQDPTEEPCMPRRPDSVSAEALVILALMADGLPLGSVASRTGMSPRTLRRRVRAVCDRLGVAHPIQAVVWAVRHGLI